MRSNQRPFYQDAAEFFPHSATVKLFFKQHDKEFDIAAMGADYSRLRHHSPDLTLGPAVAVMLINGNPTEGVVEITKIDDCNVYYERK